MTLRTAFVLVFTLSKMNLGLDLLGLNLASSWPASYTPQRFFCTEQHSS